MSDNILTVSELTGSIKRLLESSFAKVWVTGEISNYIHHTSGHRYFTLKDDNAQIKCVMWKGVGRYLKFEPENGMQVNVSGQVTVYEKSGQYQIVASSIMPVGIGALELAFQQLKEKLEKEGLFDAAHKKELPSFPEIIGVVTSPTGAAVRDIIKVLKRRAPWVKIVVRPAAVQGEKASEDVAAAIREFNEYKDVDLLIVGRGGGSQEDLWAFNEEPTARAIYDSRIPIISAVGHEIDFTISDFVADMRAPTPSAAAEIAVPEGRELHGFIAEAWHHLKKAIENKITDLRYDYNKLVSSYGLRKPLEIISQRTQRLDELNLRLSNLSSRLAEPFKNRLEIMAARLDSASPLKILGRGFSYVTVSNTGENIKSFTQTAVGDILDIKLAKGKLQVGVKKVKGD